MAEQNESNQTENNNTLVVGLGASAGGLQALKTFFESLPGQTGMAYIVVLHLAPGKESNLAQILETTTKLSVEQVSGKTPIEADHVYIIPPDKLLSVEDDHLVLSDPKKKHGLDSINVLLRTLAEKKKKYAAGIILSGSGSDGTAGLKAIKEHEGFALVQDPEEAANSSMPQSAIKTGVADKVLPVAKMAEELARYQKTFSQINLPEDPDEIESPDRETEEILSDIFAKIREHIGHDFGNYRRSSVMRRIARRMRVTQSNTLERYLNYLETDSDELDELFKDLLISVTNFFRDPESFKALEEQVIPKLFEDKGHNDEVRVWVPGCATGEEAYSIAMLLLEYSEKTDIYPELQVFASDVDEEALQTAREGRYPKSIENDVSEERLRRFFKENGSEYKAKKELQDIILFATHDLLRNAPFSNQDLIACRNLLIYLNRDLQNEVFNLLYYSLRPAGWLFLGRSDSHTGSENLFKVIDQKHHLFQHKPSSRTQTRLPDLPLLYKSQNTYGQKETPTQHRQNIEKMHWRMLASIYAPQSVLVDEDYNVVHATSGINQYLNYRGGEPSRNILDMAIPKIRQSLRGLLFKLRKAEVTPDQQKMNVKLEDKNVEITVRKFQDSDYREGLIHVVFSKVEEMKPSVDKEKISDGDISGREAEIIESLENELEYTKEQLQVSIEQYETSNEELKTSNEELRSMNEELQSTTEELETSKEELQSVNEELQTVNEELENKVQELSRANNDLKNMMEATEGGIIFVDMDLKVHQFTESSTELFNLIESDEGRPLDHITHSLDYEGLIGDLRQVRDDFEPVKKTVFAKDGREFIMRMRPYRSTEDEVEGLVLTFTEITDLRESQRRIEEKRKQESALATLGRYALAEDELQMIMHRAVQQVCSIFDLDCAVVFRLNEAKDKLSVVHKASCPGDHSTIANDPGWDVGYTLESDGPVIVSDYREEDRFDISPVVAGGNFVSSMHIAIEGARDVYGVVGLYSDDKREFSDDHINFLQNVANVLGLSIERYSARESLEISNKQLAEAIKKSEQYQKDILNSSIVERWELGGYLHDNLGQLLALAKIMLGDIKNKVTDGEPDVSEEIAQVHSIIDEGIEGVRDLTHDIIPVDIEEEGVDHAFRFLMRQTQKIHDVNCRLKTNANLHKITNRKAATNLYRVVQEAVKNAVVHGKAENITVFMREVDGNMIVEIQDDGMGMSNTDSDSNNGRGKRIMKHRMKLLGGSCEIEDLAASGQTGTCVRCSVGLDALTGEGGVI